jgi:hypothetical protein
MSLIGNLLGSGLSAAEIAEIKQHTLSPLHNVATTVTNTTGHYSRELMHGLFPDSVGQTIFDGRLVVTKVLNGYVVQYMHNPNQKPDVYVESDLDGVNDRIKALMTTFRLEKT